MRGASNIVWGRVVRVSLILAVTAATFLVTTGVAWAETRTPSRGGPGAAASTAGAAPPARGVALLLVLASVAAVVMYEAVKLREKGPVVEQPSAGARVGSEHVSAA